MRHPPGKLRPSLTRSIVITTGVVTAGALLAMATVLYAMYAGADSWLREATLQREAARVADYVETTQGGLRPRLPERLVRTDVDEPVLCVVLDAAMNLVSSSGYASALLTHPARPLQREYFRMRDVAGTAHYGISLPVVVGQETWVVQLAVQAHGEMLFDSLLEEFVLDFGWMALPFGLLLLVANGLVIRYRLLPLRHLSAQAAAIRAEDHTTRLSERAVPSELLPLVRAMNGALGRLEQEHQRQRDFIADVAHELRTPLAVVRLQLDLLGHSDVSAALQRDLAGMERLVAQLLDLARLERPGLPLSETVDLNQVARDVAEQMAPLALRQGRTVDLVVSDMPVLAKGCPDALFRAVRNLAENALTHADHGPIRLIVEPTPAILVGDEGPGLDEAALVRFAARHARGRRDRGAGAGLGLAIVAQTASLLGGRLEALQRGERGWQVGLVLPTA